MCEEIELCEWCEEKPGVFNSMFQAEDDEEEGIWICVECEMELKEDYENFMEWLTEGVYGDKTG